MRTIRAGVLILLIKMLRLYPVYAAWRGRWRVASLIFACARRLPQPCQTVIRSRDGRRFRIDPRDPMYAMGLLDRGVWEPEETNAIVRCLAPGSVVVDVGASFGWYTTLFSRLVGEHGSVHSFEPMPTAAALLQENCRLNGCTNVTINQCALGEREEYGTVYHFPDRALGDASLFPFAHEESRLYQCRITTLNDYFARGQLDRCDLIKCDVEGAELMVLRGASHVLETHTPIVLIEMNPATLRRAGCTGRDILEEMRRHDDYAFEVVGHSMTGRRFIEPTDCERFASYVNILCHPPTLPKMPLQATMLRARCR